MFNFDVDRFVAIQSGAIAIADDAHTLLGKLVNKPIERLFFMGTGGVQLLMLPSAEVLRRRSTLPVAIAHPAEVLLSPPALLDENALVVLPSLSGTTKESIDLLPALRAHGATVLSLTGHADTPVATGADYNFTNFAEDDTSSESFYLQSLIIALSLMQHRGEYERFAQTVRELRALPQLLVSAKEGFDATAAGLAQEIKNEQYHIFTGAGPAWPEAHYYAMCILEEMQWIRTRPVHAADFFHGTLELLEQGVSVFILKGEDASRPVAERVERFARRYTDRVRVLDTRDVPLPGVSDEVRALISPVVLATLLERLSCRLEAIRNHPLTTRRYYKRVEY